MRARWLDLIVPHCYHAVVLHALPMAGQLRAPASPRATRVCTPPQRLDMDMQRYQIARLHRPRAQQEAVEAEAAAALQETQARSKQGEARCGDRRPSLACLE